MFKSCIFLVLMFAQYSKADLVDIFHRRTSSALAVTAGMEDLSEALDESSQVSKDFSDTRQAVSDMREVLATGDQISEDSTYVLKDIEGHDDLSSYLSKSANKVRRAKKLARVFSLINTDPDTNTSIQATETNILLSRMIDNDKLNKSEKNELKLRKARILIAEEKQKQKEIERANQEIDQHQRKSGIVFNRFKTAKPSERYIYLSAIKESFYKDN